MSSLRFSFMFPCDNSIITYKDIKKETDSKYKILTQKEYEFCNKNISKIQKQAKYIYKLSKNPSLRKQYNLCDFELLEKNFKNIIKILLKILKTY